MKKTICVFCSSSNDIDQKYLNLAKEVAMLICKNNYNLIFGGSNVGMMKEVSNTALTGGAHVTSVIPENIHRKGIINKNSSEIILTKTLAQRKEKMEECASAFIVLPGGFGTIDELIQVIALKQLGYLKKPLVILNSFNFYDDLLNVFDKYYTEKFAKESFKNTYKVICNPDEAFTYINNELKHT